MGQPHLVVDGSNIATEGRSMPSLQQLLEAVEAISKEFDFDNTTVIVDSTFGHRIDKSEKDAYDKQVNSAQIITPPAGVIGRGDAFILEVADRADAVVLSNDSFQEFHGKYEWLFQEGRLLGGKHVPGVGWIFLARSPVRGPTSRKAVSDAKRKRRGSKKAATTAPAKKSRGSSKKQASSKPTKKAASADRAPRKSGGKEPEPYNDPLPFIEFVGAHPTGSVVEGEVEQFSSHGAYVMVDGTRCYIALKSISDPPPRSAKEVLTLGETRSFVVQAIDTPRRGIDLGLPDGTVLTPIEAPDDEADSKDESTQDRSRSRRRGRGRARDTSEDQPDSSASEPSVATPQATAAATPAESPTGDQKMSVSQRRKLRAQQAAADARTDQEDDTSGETMAKKAAKKSPAKKRPAAKKAAAKKSAAKKSTERKAPAKKTAAKKTTARKAPAKKAAAKKSAAKKSTARKAPAKKTAAKKTSARKAPAKKAAAKKSTAKKTAERKAPAKKSAAKKAPAKRSTTRKRS